MNNMTTHELLEHMNALDAQSHEDDRWILSACYKGGIWLDSKPRCFEAQCISAHMHDASGFEMLKLTKWYPEIDEQFNYIRD